MQQAIKPDSEKYTVRIIARISPSMQEALDKVVMTTRLGEKSDHIRLALAEYIERNGADTHPSL